MSAPASAVYTREPAQALRTEGKAFVREALLAVRRRTLAQADALADALGPRLHDFPYAPELNPPLWELGHLAWFQEWWIDRNPQWASGSACDPTCPRPPSLLPQADRWYDSTRVAHRSRWALPLPGAAATRDYLQQVLATTLRRLDQLPADAGDDALYFFRLAVLHECMHAEAADYMAQTLGVTIGSTAPALLQAQPAELALPAQDFALGWSGRGFAFDNELQAHTVPVAAAWLDAEPVSWGRFLPFVEAGGYESPEWWDDEGARWLAAQAVRHPRALRPAGGGWEQRRGEHWRPVEPRHVAIHLSSHEAQAWCRWAGRRLPSEAEWECAALALPGFSWGQAWEWTASAFAPYPGFAPHPYREYSAPWFGTHRVLRGACPATDPLLAHPRYRNFFEPHRADVFAGFRSARTPAQGTLHRV